MLRSATLKLQPAPIAVADNNRLRLFSGSANVPLAQEVARYLGMDLGPMIRKRFADGTGTHYLAGQLFAAFGTLSH